MSKKLAKLSPKLETELRDKLEDLLDEHDDVDDKKRRVSKALKGHLSILDDSISLVRRQLKGRDLDQLEIPGTSLPEPAKDPVVAEILKLAGGIVPTASKDEGDQEDQPEQRDGAPAKKLEPAKLVFRRGRGNGIEVANAPGGQYELASNMGFWDLCWLPEDGGREFLRAGLRTRELAQKEAERHLLERGADAVLKNAGAGELTKADTKGPAVARKKGGRRG